ncbi:Platelet-activating factor acetylhydrolase [Cytospora mali]|uniref:1-alkyl-2-acetylglycerophosphocholine esterase n=1 Tax=Cytospora mali TaxID=578113 RepID=A0A194W663_CYTMA|nr:Platelet-activating factor acetylhydrolase [Valsa mali]
MSSIFKIASPLLPGIASLIEAVLDISGAPNGSTTINFTDSNVNILPSLRGTSKVGVHTFSVLDHSRQSQIFCDVGELETSDALCNQPREIRVSMFYPACPPEEDGKNWSLSKDVQYFAPVFEPSLVANISQQLLGNATAMHNVMSHAVKNAPVCKGEYTMVMFTPAVGGQRQAYTQAASDLASLGYVAVTMDHLYLSGLVELSDGTVQAGMINETTNVLRAVDLQRRDIEFLGKALTHRAQLNQLPIWTKQAGVAPKVCVFGHGLGGTIAYNIASKGQVACGGYLDLLTLPYPLNMNKGDGIMVYNNAMGIDESLDDLLRQIFPPNEGEVITDLSPAVAENVTELDNQPLDKALPDPHSISSIVKALKEGILKTIQGLMHRISRHATGSHDSVVENNAVRKRNVGGNDCCDGKEPCHQDGCDKGWNYHHRHRPCNEGHCDDEFDGCDDCEGFCDDDDDRYHHHGGPPPDQPNQTQPDDHGDREGGRVDHPDHGDREGGRILWRQEVLPQEVPPRKAMR